MNKKNKLQKQPTHSNWKSHKQQQQLYSSKLRHALTSLNLAGHHRAKQVRQAADRILAVTANGKTRWSRAILKNRLKLKLKFRKQHKRKRVVSSSSRVLRVVRLKGKRVASFESKVKILGRLVPGCRKETLPVILEEAIHYIPALQMQVRTMTALSQLLF